ncbi:MAG: hypothetical protein WBB73_08790 [Candidatus Aminicenantaceae bacterium]
MVITRILAALCLGAVVGLACANTNSKEKSQVPFDADRWIGEWVTMWNTYDLKQVDHLFITDQRLTYLSSEKEGTLQGIEAIREHHRGFGFVEGGKDQSNKLWVDSLVTTDLGNTAVVAGIWYFERPNGEVQRGPMTMVYLWAGDQYRIVHMHFANYLEKE